jgi:hypothetical protein
MCTPAGNDKDAKAGIGTKRICERRAMWFREQSGHGLMKA